MPKTNRHAEVKPSKYKTSLCQFYVKGEACPFSSHCAFAHGEVELQFEENNVAILKATGLHRLDGQDGARSCSPSCPSSQSLTSEESAANLASPTQSSYAYDEVRMLTAAARCTRRQPVMVSLPKYNTASENTSSPYDGFYDDIHYAQFSYVHSHAIPPTSAHYSRRHGAGDRHNYLSQQGGTNQPNKCHCDFSATCRREQPLVYRHNPYSVAHCGYDRH